MATNLKLLLLRALTASVGLGCLKVIFALWWSAENGESGAHGGENGEHNAEHNVEDGEHHTPTHIDYSTFIDHELADKLYYTLLYAACLTTGQVRSW
jgi:hypothetical protein